VDNGGMNAQYRWGTSNGGSSVTDAARGNVMRAADSTAGSSFSLQTIRLCRQAETSFTLSGRAKSDWSQNIRLDWRRRLCKPDEALKSSVLHYKQRKDKICII